MLILRLSARSSISALLTVKVDLPSTVSSAPMEPSSTRTTSSVIGGSTSTALKLKLWLLKRIPNLLLPELKLLKLLPMLVMMFLLMPMLATMSLHTLKLMRLVPMLPMELPKHLIL